MNTLIRQGHRWVSIAFTATVAANFVALAVGRGQQPPAWLTYAPLLPLAVLLLTGLYLFALPYVTRRRGAHRGARRAASIGGTVGPTAAQATRTEP